MRKTKKIWVGTERWELSWVSNQLRFEKWVLRMEWTQFEVSPFTLSFLD